MACPETASVLSLEFQSCIHFKEGKKLITSVKDSTTFTHLFESYNDCQHKSNKEPEFTVSAQSRQVYTVAVLFPTRNVARVKGGLSRKDELYNNLIETFFKQHKLDLPKPVLQTEGSYIVQI
uniref:Uncharacterized protein n=1 Tax=Magallana gigas TaxID=29159 RepID=A0A8W8HR08_MAGGI